MTQVCFVLQLPVVLELLHQLGNKKSGEERRRRGGGQWKAFTDLKDRITFKARSIPSDADEEGCGEGRQIHRGASVVSVSEMVPVSHSATESQTWSACTAAKCAGCFNCYRWHREYC